MYFVFWIYLVECIIINQRRVIKQHFEQMVDLDLEVFQTIQVVALFLADELDHILPLVIVQIDEFGYAWVILNPRLLLF